MMRHTRMTSENFMKVLDRMLALPFTAWEMRCDAKHGREARARASNPHPSNVRAARCSRAY
jgi:hypothetical protein